MNEESKNQTQETARMDLKSNRVSFAGDEGLVGDKEQGSQQDMPSHLHSYVSIVSGDTQTVRLDHTSKPDLNNNTMSITPALSSHGGAGGVNASHRSHEVSL